MKAVSAALLMALLLSVSGAAECEEVDAESVVAEMLWGLDPRSRVAGDGTWVITDSVHVREKYSIARQSNCLFRASLERSFGRDRPIAIEYSFDFGAVHEFSAWRANPLQSAIITRIQGRDWYTQKIVATVNGTAVLGFMGTCRCS
jgi:hypothetical protein